jgi:hypothetical protein
MNATAPRRDDDTRRRGPATRDPDAAARARSELRRFVRDAHPDRGGDPEAFAAGLALHRYRLDVAEGRAVPSPRGPAPEVFFYSKQTGLPRLLSALLTALRSSRRPAPRVR